MSATYPYCAPANWPYWHCPECGGLYFSNFADGASERSTTSNPLIRCDGCKSIFDTRPPMPNTHANHQGESGDRGTGGAGRDPIGSGHSRAEPFGLGPEAECPSRGPAPGDLNYRSEWEASREISHEEAREIARRLIASHFRRTDCETARVGIPARPDYDDDLLICSYIKQQSRKDASAPAPPDRVGEEVGRASHLWGKTYDQIASEILTASRTGEATALVARLIADARAFERDALASAPSPEAGAGGELDRVPEAYRAKVAEVLAFTDEDWIRLRHYFPEEIERFRRVLSDRSGKLVASTGSEDETKGACRKSDGGARILAGLDDALAWAKGDTSRGKLVTIKDGQIVDVADLTPAARDHVVSARLIPWEPGSLGGVDLTFESGLRVALPLSEPDAPSDAPSTPEADR